MKFIELTTELGFKTYINLDQIVSLNRNEDNSTMLWAPDSKSYIVKETPEEIFIKAVNSSGVAPMRFTHDI